MVEFAQVACVDVMMEPPWITAPVADTFYSLHPEQRRFQDARQKKRAGQEMSTAAAQFREIEAEVEHELSLAERPQMA